jgi:hypothetical protein
VVLLEHAIGDRLKWDADCAAFARAKATAQAKRRRRQAVDAKQRHAGHRHAK